MQSSNKLDTPIQQSSSCRTSVLQYILVLFIVYYATDISFTLFQLVVQNDRGGNSICAALWHNRTLNWQLYLSIAMA